MEENYSTLENNDYDTFIKATYLRVFMIRRQGNTINDITKMLYKGYGCLLPIMIYIEGKTIMFYAFFTMGTSTLAQVGHIPRQLCPGMSYQHYGCRFNNSHPLEFPSNLLISVTHCVAIDTRASYSLGSRLKNISKEEIDYYTAMTIGKDGGELRIVKRIYECVNKNKNLVVIKITVGKKDHSQHRFIHLYAAACGIGTTSYENILCKIRHEDSKLDNVNVNKWTDVDHGFHRLMTSSNSIYLSFPMDHTSNQWCGIVRKKAGDWCLALTKRYYNCGN